MNARNDVDYAAHTMLPTSTIYARGACVVSLKATWRSLYARATLYSVMNKEEWQRECEADQHMQLCIEGHDRHQGRADNNMVCFDYVMRQRQKTNWIIYHVFLQHTSEIQPFIVFERITSKSFRRLTLTYLNLYLLRDSSGRSSNCHTPFGWDGAAIYCQRPSSQL